MLTVKKLNVVLTKNKQTILQNINLQLPLGSINFLLGANGAGKSVLLQTIMGNPEFTIASGSIQLAQKNISMLLPDQRSKQGLYLIFQDPPALAGVKVLDYFYKLYTIHHAVKLSAADFYELVLELLEDLKLSSTILQKELNVEFSGGEKKKLEVITMLLIRPTYILLDELDSGLDIDARKLLFKRIYEYWQETKCTLLVVSHHFAIADILPPQRVFVLEQGQIIKQGDKSLISQIQQNGFTAE